MVDYELDNIETLKANKKETKLSDQQQKILRIEVKKIMKRREKEEKARRRAEVEHMYELGLYA